MHFERHFALQNTLNYTCIFFPENLEKVLGFTSKFREGRVTPIIVFFIWP